MINGGCVSVDTNRRLLFATKIVAAEVVFLAVPSFFSFHDGANIVITKTLKILTE